MPRTKAGLTPPVFHTAVRVHLMLGILCDSLGNFLSLDTHIKMLVMGNLFSLALTSHYNQAPLPSPVPTAVSATGAGPRDPLRGDRDLRLLFQKAPGQLGTGQHAGQIGSLCLQDPQPQAPMSHPSARTPTSTCTCTFSGFGRRTQVRG